MKARQQRLPNRRPVPDKQVATWDDIEDNLKEAKSCGANHVILVGDLNYDLLDPNAKAKTMFNNLHMEQLIKEPTHYGNDKAALLDISADMIESKKVLPSSLSNHCEFELIINVAKQKYLDSGE